MSKSAISDEMRVDMVKLFYANGSSWMAARRALTKKYGNEGRKIHLRTIQRQVTKFERELTLRRKATGGGAKTAVTEKNIKKVDNEDEDEKVETIRTANYIAMLRGKVIPVLKRKKILDPCIFQQDGTPPN